MLIATGHPTIAVSPLIATGPLHSTPGIEPGYFHPATRLIVRAFKHSTSRPENRPRRWPCPLLIDRLPPNPSTRLPRASLIVKLDLLQRAAASHLKRGPRPGRVTGYSRGESAMTTQNGPVTRGIPALWNPSRAPNPADKAEPP